jgi:prepilin-type N-terminal cleavage/methylation domain-containing protein
MRLKKTVPTGFTLVEMAVVVALVGLLMGIVTSVASTWMARAAFAAAQGKQAAIKEALINFLARKQRLPCPSDVTPVDGLERYSVPACNSQLIAGKPYFGIVPYTTLGLPLESALDAQGNFLALEIAKSATGFPFPLGGAAGNFLVGANGNIVVNDAAHSLCSNSVDASQTTASAAAILISYGTNGYGAWTPGPPATQRAIPPAISPDELQNTKGTLTFCSRAPASDFDDIVRAFSADDILTPLVRDGTFKSAPAQLTEQIATIRETVIGATTVTASGTPPPANTCTLPAVMPTSLPTNPQYNASIDPWGNPMSYAYGPGLNFTISSPGSPPTTPGTTITIPAAYVKARLSC